MCNQLPNREPAWKGDVPKRPEFKYCPSGHEIAETILQTFYKHCMDSMQRHLTQFVLSLSLSPRAQIGLRTDARLVVNLVRCILATRICMHASLSLDFMILSVVL